MFGVLFLLACNSIAVIRSIGVPFAVDPIISAGGSHDKI
jgi:hypothetical protein